MEWFPNVQMNQVKNIKHVLEEIKSKYDIKEPRDWGKFSTKELKKTSAFSIINRYYKGSLFHCLRTNYPGCSTIVVSNFIRDRMEGKLV